MGVVVAMLRIYSVKYRNGGRFCSTSELQTTTEIPMVRDSDWERRPFTAQNRLGTIEGCMYKSQTMRDYNNSERISTTTETKLLTNISVVSDCGTQCPYTGSEAECEFVRKNRVVFNIDIYSIPIY